MAKIYSGIFVAFTGWNNEDLIVFRKRLCSHSSLVECWRKSMWRQMLKAEVKWAKLVQSDGEFPWRCEASSTLTLSTECDLVSFSHSYFYRITQSWLFYSPSWSPAERLPTTWKKEAWSGRCSPQIHMEETIILQTVAVLIEIKS